MAGESFAGHLSFLCSVVNRVTARDGSSSPPSIAPITTTPKKPGRGDVYGLPDAKRFY